MTASQWRAWWEGIFEMQPSERMLASQCMVWLDEMENKNLKYGDPPTPQPSPKDALASLVSIGVPVAVAQRAVDALCRGHKACLQLDCARSVLNGKEEVEESPLTKALETSMNEMRQALEAAGIAW